VDCRRSSIGKATLTLLLLLSACQETDGPLAIEADTSTPEIEIVSTGINAVPDILQWVKLDSDIVSILSQEPAECINTTSSDQEQVLLGRLAFRSPFLLGGQAVRNGLACQSCHTQGQINQAFFVTGMSDEIGTADVTNFHFSKSLGDQVFNPAPIPSLADDIFGVDHDPNKSDLENLVLKLITKEFSGKDPNPDVLKGLLTYIRALDDQSCPEPNALIGEDLLIYQLDHISQSFKILADGSFQPETQSFAIAALRSEIGRIYNRFPSSPELSTALAEVGQTLNERSSRLTKSQITDAGETWQSLRQRLINDYNKSLFNPAFIEAWAAHNKKTSQ